MAACAVRYVLDFGLVLRFLAGEYTAEWRDVEAVIVAVEPHISESDKDHIFQILTTGCPTKMVWEETAQNKETFIKRGNSPSAKANSKEMVTVLYKEEQNHHLVAFPSRMCRGSPYVRSTPHTVIVKSGKKARLIWDGTAKKYVGKLE